MIGEYNNRKLIPKKGSIFKNRTLHFITPSIKSYGEEFILKYKTLACLATGVGNKDIDPNNNLYSLFDVNGKSKYDTYLDKKEGRIHFTYILSWLKDQPYYVNDYPFDSGMKGYQHMIVLKIPEFVNMEAFLSGSYSTIYPKDKIDQFYSDQIPTPDGKKIINMTKLILTKNNSYVQNFITRVKNEFGTTLDLNDINNDTEFDFPPKLVNEVFNYGIL